MPDAPLLEINAIDAFSFPNLRTFSFALSTSF